ncbi:MAG TPA: DUF4149 domain-containing protein [Bryobacterales bacterium]|nr:DUF4149 domain-containing protein [Bryobacterales bacterium]
MSRARSFLSVVHVVSLSLWFGAVTFFAFFTALPILDKGRALAATPDKWLGIAGEEAGTRLGGEMLSAVFAHYFWYQTACGVAAWLTAGAWPSRSTWIRRVRQVVLAAALGLALANAVYLGPQVHALRQARYTGTPAARREAAGRFAKWHRVSLAADLAGWCCLLAATTLAGALPRTAPSASACDVLRDSASRTDTLP